MTPRTDAPHLAGRLGDPRAGRGFAEPPPHGAAAPLGRSPAPQIRACTDTRTATGCGGCGPSPPKAPCGARAGRRGPPRPCLGVRGSGGRRAAGTCGRQLTGGAAGGASAGAARLRGAGSACGAARIGRLRERRRGSQRYPPGRPGSRLTLTRVP